MTNQDIPERLVRIFREELHQPGLHLTAAMTPDDVSSWDSTAMASIIMSIEEEFGFEMSAAELRNVRCVGDLAHIVAEHPE